MTTRFKRIKQIYSVVFAALLLTLLILLLLKSLEVRVSPVPESKVAAVNSEFHYKIADGASGSETFPHTFRQLATGTDVTVTVDIEARKHDQLLLKTVYSGLQLYADEQLIYEAGQPGTFPEWLLDPPTLLAIVELPAEAEILRFEYSSPTQRDSLNLPVPLAGSENALLRHIFYQNSALLAISALILLIGLASVVSSLFFWHSFEAGKPFLYHGLFAITTGCWGLAESNATAFFFPYPAFLLSVAMVSLAAFAIPLLSYALLILRPENPLPLKIGRGIISFNLLVVIFLQLLGIRGFAGSLPLIQFSAVAGIIIYTFSVFWEHFKHKNAQARRFALPTLIMLAATLLEYLNYSARFTDILSLFFLSGTLLFVLLLGLIGVRNARKLIREAEDSRRAAKKLALMRQMSHDMLTPLTRVSTNVQMAALEPETAVERLANAQADVMSIADTVNKVLSSEEEMEEQA